MGRKSELKDKRARRYIRILDEEKWTDIDKLRTIKKYENSFNQLINDALDYGLPMLIKAEMEDVKTNEKYKIEEPPTENYPQKELDMYYRLDELLEEIIGILQEVVLTATINKSLLCSLFNQKVKDLSIAGLLGLSLKNGDLRDTPEYLESYERRGIREINKRRKTD